MAKYIQSQWDVSRLLSSLFFESINTYLKVWESFSEWPGLTDYQAYLEQVLTPLTTGTGRSLRVVTQARKAQSFAEQYVSRIYHLGEMQTRLSNWHDFFQVITWRVFPLSKRAINTRHYHAAKLRFASQKVGGQRSAEENLLSLLDECGAIVVSDKDSMLQLIKDFAWKTLFFQQRALLSGHMECILFGHALYEKTFKPYIGMTANAVLIKVPSAYFTMDAEHRLQLIDKLLSERLQQAELNGYLYGPRDLAPLPLLGFPGFWAGNQHAAFYDNTHYFRPGRRSPQ